MTFDQFKQAVDSMVDYPKMTGMMGGEPLLHPEFEKFCEYMHSKIPPERCGLWTCLPRGKEKYRDAICKTFGHIFINDHTRSDILHGPVLVASEEIDMPEDEKWSRIDKCWVQNAWSASINPKGAFFCEIAASLAMLEDKSLVYPAWKVEPGWWKKIPKDFKYQMEYYCKKCGAAMPLKKRESIDGRDDVSPKWVEKLKEVSPKMRQGKYVEHDLKLCQDDRQTATYKDKDYRDKISAGYGMFLTVNKYRFQTPHLKSNWKGDKK